MLKIEATFLPFNDVTLYDCIGTTGVYVIWDQAATLVPTYIGKGNLFDRLKNHHSKFKSPLDGYVAVLGDVDDREADHNAEMLEGMLLWASKEKNRKPRANRNRAGLTKIKRKLKKHNLIRSILKGYDPFSHPRAPRILSKNKRFIRVFVNTSEELDIEHPFQLLRGTKA